MSKPAKTTAKSGKKQTKTVAQKVSNKPAPRRPLMMVVAALALIIAVLAAYSFYRQPTVSEAMDTIKSKTESKYSNVAVDASQWPAQMGSQLSLHATGYDYNVSSQSFPSLYFTLKETPQVPSGTVVNSPKEITGTIDAEMDNAGFKVDSANHTNEFTLYGRKDTTCFRIYTDQQFTVTFTCYDHNNIAGVSQDAQPFVNAFNKANPTQPINLNSTIGPIVIKSHYGAGAIGSSHEAGYDIAEAVVTQSNVKKLVLFYNKYGGDWQYITKANDEFGFSCKDYTANADVRKAMFDQICLGDQGQVRLDTNNRALQ
ncbi:MAG TPA: hypothetical protein VLH86_04970 [Patescibacteria group bacterium]|nr:hypothetical protein [Patescibacteria group bacterium]